MPDHTLRGYSGRPPGERDTESQPGDWVLVLGGGEASDEPRVIDLTHVTPGGDEERLQLKQYRPGSTREPPASRSVVRVPAEIAEALQLALVEGWDPAPSEGKQEASSLDPLETTGAQRQAALAVAKESGPDADRDPVTPSGRNQARSTDGRARIPLKTDEEVRRRDALLRRVQERLADPGLRAERSGRR